MARTGFTIEKFLQMVSENGDSGATLLFGSGAPGGDTNAQDAAELGSGYLRTDNFEFYQKLANAGAAADWYSYGSLYTVLGISKGDVDLGTFTGGIVTDNSDVRTVIQDLIDYITSNIVEDLSEDGVTTVTTIDEELVDNVCAVHYFVCVSLADDPARRQSFFVHAMHDGTASADAANIDDNVYSKNKHGATFDYSLTVELSGTGTAQEMQLRVASTETNGVDVRARKVGQVLF
jgi:hypothetical protein